MKKIFFVLIIMPFCFAVAQEQIISAVPISNQKIVADDYLGFDGLGNYYYSQNNILFKSDKLGTIWQFKNLSLGKFTRVDVQNPLKILVFYENFNMVVLLDNQLNIIQKILFSQNNTPLVVSAFGLASQNRLWMYNSLSQQIGLFDYINNTFESLTTPFKGYLKYYESDFNYFQWIDEKHNWYSCDIYGKIKLIGQVSDYDQIQLVDYQSAILLKDGILSFHNFQKNITFKIINVENSFKKFYYKDRILSIFTDDGITNYKITIPQ